MDQKSTNFVNVTLEKNYKCLGIFYHFSLLWTGSNKKISISSTGPALQKSHNHSFLSCSYIMSRNSFPPGVDKIGNKTFLDPVSKCYESPFSFFSFSFFFFYKRASFERNHCFTFFCSYLFPFRKRKFENSDS